MVCTYTFEMRFQRNSSMRAALFLVLSFFVFFSVNKAYAFSCDLDLNRHYNILDIVLQNDLIFVGEWIGYENNNGERIFEYKVIEPLKGSLEGITSLKVKDPNMLFSLYQANFPEDKSLIYVHYGEY